MLLCRRTLSRATITLFTLLVLQVVLCRGQAGEVLIPPVDQTVPVGSEAEFFCRVRGEHQQLRVNGKLLFDVSSAPRPPPEGITVVTDIIDMDSDEANTIDINVTIEATVDHNNTILSCVSVDQGSSKPSTANLTVQGAPAIPEVEYDLLSLTEAHLSWFPPFTWDDYGIVGYHIRCVNYTSTQVLVEETVNNTTLSFDYTLPEDAPDCSQITCNVTASNSLGESGGSNLVIQFPVAVASQPRIKESTVFTEMKTPEITFCIQLPDLCSFQEVTYTIRVTSENKHSVQRTGTVIIDRVTDDCVQEKFSDGLEEGVEYSAVVFIDTGPLTGNSSSTNLTFKPELQGLQSSSNGEDFFSTETGRITVIAVAVVVVVLVVLITVLAVAVMVRGRKSKRNGQSKAPLKRTVTPMVTNPIYGDDGPVYEHIAERGRTPSFNHQHSVTSQTALDSPHGRIPSPTHSCGSHSSSSSHRFNNVSPYSHQSFNFPYAVVRPTDPASFDAIQASVQTMTRVADQGPALAPHGTPGEENYMTMNSVAHTKNVNVENDVGRPHYAIDIHGNQYIEC